MARPELIEAGCAGLHVAMNFYGARWREHMSEMNRASWNRGAAAYSAKFHTDEILRRIAENPASTFHAVAWEMICKMLPDLRGKKICVPSSGDNHAVFAFAQLGARVTSCDISENQLANADHAAKKFGWDIEFVRADTMGLSGVADGSYDFVYTSNGVHVWINDLAAMYRGIHRVLAPGGLYMLYEIHPFQRPFDDGARVVKPYDATGPFEGDSEITYHWRLMDIVNAMLDSGLAIRHVEEMPAQKDYEHPFWISLEDTLRGVTATREEVDRMHDWRTNPMAALPNWLCAAAVKV